MKELITIQTGSHAYGTNHSLSDNDLIGVHLPCAQSILMQTVQSSVRKEKDDYQSLSLSTFLFELEEGQPRALEMIFSPTNLWIGKAHPLWLEILSNIQDLLPVQTIFLKYSKSQSGAFGADKMIRMSTLQEIVSILKLSLSKDNDQTLATIYDRIKEKQLAGITFHGLDCTSQQYQQPVMKFANKQIPLNTKTRIVLEMFESAIQRYGARSKKAENNGGTDWKSLMHALRIAEEGIEYYEKGKITLPRPNFIQLKKIRMGEENIDVVRDMIAQQQEILSSITPKETSIKIDSTWRDNFVMDAYADQVDQWLKERENKKFFISQQYKA